MTVKDILGSEQMTVDAYADRAEIVRTDPMTYQTKVIQFSPKALFEGSEADDLPWSDLDQVVDCESAAAPQLLCSWKAKWSEPDISPLKSASA